METSNPTFVLSLPCLYLLLQIFYFFYSCQMFVVINGVFLEIVHFLFFILLSWNRLSCRKHFENITSDKNYSLMYDTEGHF